jgi:hypothetical protein
LVKRAEFRLLMIRLKKRRGTKTQARDSPLLECEPPRRFRQATLPYA